MQPAFPLVLLRCPWSRHETAFCSSRAAADCGGLRLHWATHRDVFALNSVHVRLWMWSRELQESGICDHVTWIKVKKELNKELIYSWPCHACYMKWSHDVFQMLLDAKFISAHSVLYKLSLVQTRLLKGPHGRLLYVKLGWMSIMYRI